MAYYLSRRLYNLRINDDSLSCFSVQEQVKPFQEQGNYNWYHQPNDKGQNDLLTNQQIDKSTEQRIDKTNQQPNNQMTRGMKSN